MEKINITIIDDHQLVRNGLKELLESIGNYNVVEEFESGFDFINTLEKNFKSDLYILDYSMPEMNGIEVLKKLEEENEEYKVLLLTQEFEEEIINAAYNFGARGFLHKNCTAQDLKFAIDSIVNIGYNNVSEILKRIRHYEDKKETFKNFDLTEREQHFLELVCNENEYTYEQMSEIMNVSVKSIDVYRTALFDKFNIKSKVGLVLFSFKNKITKPFV